MRNIHLSTGEVSLSLLALLWAVLLVGHYRLFAGESDLVWQRQHISIYWNLFFVALACALPLAATLGNAFLRGLLLAVHAGLWAFLAYSLGRFTGVNSDTGLYCLASALALAGIVHLARATAPDDWLQGRVQ